VEVSDWEPGGGSLNYYAQLPGLIRGVHSKLLLFTGFLVHALAHWSIAFGETGPLEDRERWCC